MESVWTNFAMHAANIDLCFKISPLNLYLVRLKQLCDPVAKYQLFIFGSSLANLRSPFSINLINTGKPLFYYNISFSHDHDHQSVSISINFFAHLFITYDLMIV